MDYFIIAIAAFGASVLTFFSGFGLGTLLMPIVALFFPIEVAIAATGVVHITNNLFKLSLVGRYVHWRIGWQVGLPAFVTAMFGAWVLLQMQRTAPLASYQYQGSTFFVTAVKVLVGLLLLFFAIAEWKGILGSRPWRGWRSAMLGGMVSGFFGGLSGHQGALRSAFLVKAGLGKESFIATGVLIALFVDIARIPVYFKGLSYAAETLDLRLLVTAVLSAAAGAVAGSKLLKKVSLKWVQQVVFVMLVCMALLLLAGIV